MFEDFNDDVRIWIYGFRKPLSRSDREKVENAFKKFVARWQAHQVPVRGDFEVLENRFIVLAAEDSISGCSIDSSVSVFKDLQRSHHLDALDFDLVFFKKGDKIIALRRDEFRNMVENNLIPVDTEVYDLTLTNLGELRSGKFRIPFEKSWHWRAFKQSA